MVDSPEAKRIQQTNYERQMLASSRGWGFAPDAPELLQKWPVKPFSENGDKRMAFGVVSGAVNGAAFTAFDFHRRTKITHVGSLAVDIVVVKTVWVLTLPATLPRFEIMDMTEPEFDKTGTMEPRTADTKVNRSYLLVGTDPGLANQFLTPAVTGVMKQHKLVNWSTYGDQLLCVKHPIFGRVKPDELESKVGELAQLISVLPPHLWGTGGAPQQYQQPPQQQYPPQQQFQQQHYPPQPQYQQPYPQQPYQQPYPAQHYPPQPYYPQQQYPQQPYYPPPGYPPRGY